MNKETVPIHQLILGLFTTVPTPINNIVFWSLVDYFLEETNTQLTGSYDYITLYTPGKYIGYDYGNGCWKFKKDYSLNSIINVDGKEQTIREYFQTLAGERVNNFFQSFNKEKYKTYQEELLKAGKIRALNQANILLISDREEDYKVLLEYGFRNINWLKSYSRANNFFEKNPWYLTQHHIIILGNQNEKPNTDAFYRAYPLDEKIRRQARDQNTIKATLEVYNLSDGSISFQSDITDAYHGYTHEVSGQSYQELLASILEVFSSVPTKPRKFYRIPNYTNPIKIPLPTKKKDLKVCYAIDCPELNTATTGINVTQEEDNYSFNGIVKSKLGNFDITIANRLNSSELLTMAKGSTEQCKDTGRQLTLFVTYEFPYYPNPNAIKIRYRFGGELAKDTEIHEVEFNTLIKPNTITNNASSFSRENAVLGAATHIYNNALKELGMPTIKDLNTPSAHGIVLKSAEESAEEYNNIKKAIEDFAITSNLAITYLKSRYNQTGLNNISIKRKKNSITITKYYESNRERIPLCAVTFKKNCCTNGSCKLAVQTLKESGILSAPQEVCLTTYDNVDSPIPTEKQQKAIAIINQAVFEQLYDQDDQTYSPKNPIKRKK